MKERKPRGRTGCSFSSKTYRYRKLFFGKEVTNPPFQTLLQEQKYRNDESFRIPLEFL